MAAKLADVLLTEENKPKVVDDCCALIDQGVAEGSGVGGTAVKLAYKAVNTFKSGHVRYMVESMLPDMVDQLEPYWADFAASGSGSFGDYLAKRGPEVSEALLSVTDARAKESNRPVVIRAYNSVRGGAAKHMQGALPRLGDLVVKYAG
jgi:hypothetical protein